MGDKDIVVVTGAFGGRFDQIMSNLHVSHIMSQQAPSIVSRRVYLVGDKSLSFFIPPGTSRILPPKLYTSDTFALIPMGTPCRSVTTEGLQWNLAGDRLELGKFISTSNRVVGEHIKVTCSDPLLCYFEARDYGT